MPVRSGSWYQASIVLLVMCAGGSIRIAAQEAPMLRLTLDEARRRAVESSNRLAEIGAREAAAQAVIAARQALEKPVIAAAVGYTRTNHVLEFVVPGPAGVSRVLYPDVPDNYRTRLDLQWPIYNGGRTDALERAARAEARAVSGEAAAARADLRLDVTRAFWALATARATVDVIDRGLGRARGHVADARARSAAGLVPPNELASAQAQEARQRMLFIEARNQRDLSAADLARLIGAGPTQAIDPAAALDDGALRDAAVDEDTARANGAPEGGAFGNDVSVNGSLTQAVETLVEEGTRARGERQSLEARIAAAVEQRTAAMASRRPNIAVAAGVDYARPNPRIFPRARQWEESWDAGVNVSWSLWDGGRVAAEAAQASSLSDAARYRLAEFDSLMALEVRQRWLEIDSGRAAVVAAGEAVRAAAEARRVVTERYRVGVIGQTEVLDAEVALLQAELDRTRAWAGVRLAQARLDRAVGR
jgi:outer membrane protein